MNIEDIRDKSDEEILELLNTVKGLGNRLDIIKTLSDDKKIGFINEFKIENYRVELIISLNYENRINMIDQVKKPSNRRKIVHSLLEEADSVDKKIELLNITNKFGMKDINFMIVKQISSEVLVEKMDQLDKQNITNFRNNRIFDLKEVYEHIEDFMKNEGVETENLPEKKVILDKLLEKDEEICLSANFEFLDEKNIQILTQERFELMACYPDIQKQFLEVAKDDNKIQLFNKCLEDFIKCNGDSEWKKVTEDLLTRLSSNEYDELINSIDNSENIDFTKLTNVLTNENFYEIKSIEDLEQYQEIKKDACQSIMSGNKEELKKFPKIEKMTTLERKKFAVLQTKYGQDIKEAETILKKYSQDIENSTFLDEKSQKYIQDLKYILQIEDEQDIDTFYESLIQLKDVEMDTTIIESNFKKTFAKEYNKDLFKPEQAEEIYKNENIYYAGTDFKMIITSVGAIHTNTIGNYKDDWNRDAIISQGFCTSYIRNDMLGTADIPHVCYGFSEMSEDSLMLSGAGDIYSDTKKLNVSAAHSEKYLSPDTQINNTEGYNEMVYKRIQNGERKQPDYIVVFKRDGKIANMEEAKKAQQDWGKDEQGKYKMPIVVVDVDKCLEAESEKVDGLMKQYEQNPTPQNEKEIYQKVRNNRVTTKRWGGETFREDINLEELKEKMTQIEEKESVQQKVTKQDLSENYSKVSAKERAKGIDKFKKFIQNIKAKVLKETDDKNVEGER